LSEPRKYLVAAGIGVIVTYGIIQSRQQVLEARVSNLEMSVNYANARIAEFENRHRADVPQLQYQYQMIRRDVDELKRTFLVHEQKLRVK